MRQTVSLKDISEACGVSVATVSKALNDHTDISGETKQKVREAARALGYFPNSAAKALKTNKTNNIGVLFADEAHSGLTHEHFAAVLESFKTTAEAAGYDLTFINSSRKRSDMSYLDHARYRGVDGIMIACVDFYDPQVEELVRGNLPVVTIDHVFDNRVSIISDNIQVMRDLVTYCYKKGHRKIAYIHGGDSSVTQNRLSSFYKTVSELGLFIPDSYLRMAEYRSSAESYEETNALLNLPDPPTCILYPDDFAALGGISAIRDRGLSYPDDISIVGYDGIPLSRQLMPQLTTLQQDTEKQGRLAAQKLIDLIDQPRTTIIENLMVEGMVLEGGSVKDLTRL